METLRLQIMAPSQINLGGLATQRRRPVWVGYVNGAAAVAAHLAWKAQEQEFLQPLLGRGARFMKEMAPASVGYVLADQLLRPVLPLLPRAMTQVLAAVRFLALEVRRQPAEIRGGGGSFIRLESSARHGVRSHGADVRNAT